MAEPARSFADLGLPEPLLAALAGVGYEIPTPIQALTVPPLLAGRDVLGNAPTGTGKTAAFALPILARLDRGTRGVQALVLTPTRELAIQVAEAFARYASASPGLRVLPLYGGQDYAGQLKALARGVQIVVGTPGRVADHLRRGTLKLDALRTLVLDEADEMLRMGFVDEVEWILGETPAARQTALFSATMPPPIRRIARRHLKAPEEIGIENRRAAAATIRQRVWMVGGGMDKLEALTRILEVEPFEAMLVFVRTRSATVELAEKLEARGFAASAMNGDMPQKERERQVDKLRRGTLDILVATDVVARGLDVERISHVINYDIPYDTEAYVHRIGRTGRAGRSGEAILFVVPRERRLLGAIEQATRQKVESLELPTAEMVNERRVEAFEAGIDESLAAGELGFLEHLVERYAANRELPMARVAAAVARLAIGDRPLLLEERSVTGNVGKRKERGRRDTTSALEAASGTRAAAKRTEARQERHESASRERASRTPKPDPSIVMERFRVEVGREHGVQTADLVGAIASEADIRAEYIGRVDVREDHSIVELPEGMPKFMLKELRRAWVCGRKLAISRLGADGGARVPAGAHDSRSAPPSKSARESKASSDSPRGPPIRPESRPGPKAGSTSPPSASSRTRASKPRAHRKGTKR